MDEASHRIERHIRQTRNDLDDNLNELEDKVKKAVDWRAQFEERPGTMLGLAFAGGVVLSALFSSGRGARSSYSARGDLWGTQAWNRPASPSTPPASKPSETRQNVEALAGALIGVAVNRASRFIDSLVPGFEREFSARASKTAASSQSGVENLAEPHTLRSAAAEND